MSFCLMHLAFHFLLIIASVVSDCPPGTAYESTFNKCYGFFNSPSTFLAAEQTCNSIGGHLVFIQNAYENSYVAGIVTGATKRTPNFWIGANLLLTSSWSWTANASMTYANWANGQPISTNPCGIIRDIDSRWITSACNSPLPFVCAVDPTSPLPGTPCTTCPNDAICSSGYTLFPGNCMCYKYFADYKSYSAANATCAQNGGTLAKSTSAEVNKFLTVFPQINCGGASCPYIGLQCNSSSLSSCKWADGSPLGNYTNFFFGGPQSTRYSYVIVAAYGGDADLDQGKWEPHSDSRTYICEKAPTKASLFMKSQWEVMKEQSMKRRMTSSVDLN